MAVTGATASLQFVSYPLPLLSVCLTDVAEFPLSSLISLNQASRDSRWILKSAFLVFEVFNRFSWL